MEKYFVFIEWADFDSGGMGVEQFDTETELNDFLVKEYPNGFSEAGEPFIVKGKRKQPKIKAVTQVVGYSIGEYHGD